MVTESQKSILFIGNFLSEKGMNQGIANDLSARLKSGGWKVLHASSYRNKILRLLDMILTAVRNHKQYRSASIDVFSDQAFVFADVMSIVFMFLRKPVVGVLRGGHLAEFEKKNPKRVRTVLGQLTKVTTPSLFLGEHFSKIRPDIQRIPNGIDLAAYDFCPREKPAPKLIWLRALHQIYAPWLAVEVHQRLRGEFPRLRLTLVGPDKGDGSLERVLALAEKYHLNDALQVVGGVPKEDVPAWLNKGDIFLNTTRIESFGVSVLEAAACGLPIVTTDAGELPMMWEDGVDALLVPVDDPAAMAAAVRRILTEPGLAGKLSANARKKAENYDWSLIMPKWEALFESLVDEQS